MVRGNGLIATFFAGMLAGILIMTITLGVIIGAENNNAADVNDVYRFKVIAVSSMVAVEGTFETELPINPGDQWALVFMKQEVGE